jgi:uncharacterized tellurite resistance protein B-like protein
MDRELRRKVCGLILGMVVKDGVISDEERTFVRRLVGAFGLSKEDGSAIEPITDGEQATETLGSLPVDERRETMDLLIEAAAVDGHVAPAERAHLDAVGRAVGWSPDEVAARVAAIVGAARLP